MTSTDTRMKTNRNTGKALGLALPVATVLIMIQEYFITVIIGVPARMKFQRMMVQTIITLPGA